MKLIFPILGMLASTSLFASVAMAQPQVSYVEEMAPLPFSTSVLNPAPCTLSAAEQADWKKLFPFVSSLITDKQVASLSRWARNETSLWHYFASAIPPLKCVEKDGKNAMYEATLATLPSHSPLVTRQLKAYLYGPQIEGMIAVNHIAITIRGWVEE